ncbi:MAG: hypothetical protein A2126_01580 [Candidatus Woykebacteria bacterium GWB1_45_5]|uniref:Uncharacterized protein n=1 Tax=Candidatus Woykebacteria bacterium GWB1_45_5 TaxID=1802592 RepID=A0A1G1W6X3_9BACT|nr:MAG: hypothetical protein A2126_01580 [Candidatus Woykebacteria bacterium GWB1_45_5]
MFCNKAVKNKVGLPSVASSRGGQALIELILATALAAVFLAALATGVIAAREGFARSGKSLEATLILQKEVEGVRSIKETAWNSIANPGTYHVEQSGNGWTAAASPITENGFTRSFTVENVCRSSPTSPPVNCPSGTVDPSTKKIAATVSWSFLGTKSISSVFYISRYFGNQTWLQTTKADFDAGTFDNTRSTNQGGGMVELRVGGGQDFVDDYTNSGDYTFDSNKIEVTGGFAQLKAQGSTISGQTINPGFDTGVSGWTFAPWGNNISQTGNYRSGGGNPGGYAEINMPAAKNKNSGGYWYQPFTTTVANPTTTLRLDWRVTAYQATPKSFHLYAFVDTASGAPNVGQNVWDSGNITGVTSWASVVNIDVSSRVTTARTYYLKVAVFVEYPGSNRGPYTIGFDNVLLTWSKTVGGGYPTDKPTIYRNTSFTAPSITAWNSFTETAQKNGGSIMYQLSDDGGATWRFFNGIAWVVATGPTDYNDAGTVNNRISSFPTTNRKIGVRAFLISDGTQFVRLDRIVIGYTGSETGTYTSSTFIAGGIVSFNRIVWTETQTPNTTIRFQTAINFDNTTWDFVGPDGTAATYFTGGSGIINLTSVSGQYLRFRIYFTSTGVDVPSVADVTVNYSP